MAVKVQFQIGHTSKLRSKKTVEGFTHDWELYVKGVQQADISAFVDKIVFNLHESFQKPKRVCNKPPYVIQESGYAGFIVFIDIYFRNRDEPKKVQFNYDLDLQQTGPPQHRHDVKTFIFDNPSEEYRQKLLKGGGVPVSGVVGGAQPTVNNNLVTISNAASLTRSPGENHKTVLTEGKKHKLRPEDTRTNSFANLFGPPITKTSVATTANKHSPDNKTALAVPHPTHQASAGATLPAAKEKSSKDKEKSSEKSKERSEKKEKHHKQSLTGPHKEGRSESKKSDSSKHEKRDKTEEKSKKDKSRDKDRERDREKPSGTNVNNNSSNSKRPTSPKPAREHSPHKSLTAGVISANITANNTNSVPRPSSSNSGKLEEIKTSGKSKESSGENKSKESKQKESSSSSSGKKSKKEKKDKDKERDKDKRHEEREKQKLAESQQRSTAKEDGNKSSSSINTHLNNTNNLDNKNAKPISNPSNTNALNNVVKKPDKLIKQDLFKSGNDKNPVANTSLAQPSAMTNNSNEKKSSSSSSLNSNSNPAEKDKRSHKHKKKEKNKDKDKDRERDKEREKDKDKERDKDKEKEKEKEARKEKEAKGKHPEGKATETFPLTQPNTNATKVSLMPAISSTEQHSNSPNTSNSSSSIKTNAASNTTTTTAIASSTTASSTKSSKNKDKKSKDRPSTKENKMKHKSNDSDMSGSKAKQAKLCNNNSVHTPPSLSTSSSSSSVSTSIANAIANPQNLTQPTITTAANSTTENKLNLDLSDADSLPAASADQPAPLPTDSVTNPSLLPSPNITHSDSSNSSFPDLTSLKQKTSLKAAHSKELSKTATTPVGVASASGPASAPAPVPSPATSLSPAVKEPPKAIKSTTKEKLVDKPPKEEEREKKRRRNSQTSNTFIEPPLKQLKTKEPTKTVREKSKSPSLRNTGSHASVSAEVSTTFLQPSASPSSSSAAAPLPPPSSASSAAHSPALSATEAVGNATSATANAATCNSNSTPSSTSNSIGSLAPHQLPLDYLSELQELHHKIMTLQDNEDLQHVVELIAATGCYEITTKTFDFDLCKLDRGTVQRLQEFFATSVS